VRDAPRYAYLSEGLVDLLARDLQGSGLRAVDSASVLRALGGDPTAELDRVRGASAQLGAKYFVLGRIEERRGELLLEAVLHTGDAGEPVTQTLVQGDPAELLSMVRKLSDNLQMRPLPPKEFDARLAGLARRTSRSPVALQAWLEGERLLRRGHWVAEEVMGAFQRAVGADPEFALAQYRLATMVYLAEPGLAEDSLRRALRNSDRLTPAERMLVEGQLAAQQGRFSDAERTFLDATRRYPDEEENWTQLGELYFHQNPLRARSPQEALSAFQHVLVIDPLHTEAISHLVDLALVRSEKGLVARLTDRLLSLSDDQATVLSFRLAKAWARDDSDERGKVMNELRAPGVPRSLLKLMFVRAEWQMDGFVDAEQVARLFARADTAVDRSYSQLTMGIVQLLRGRPGNARAAIARAVESYPGGDGHANYVLPWIDTLSFVTATPAQLAAARAEAERIDSRDAAQVAPAKRYLIGALSARAGDMVAAEKAARALDRMEPMEGSSITTDLALAVRARILAARGELAAALALLEKQELRVPFKYAPFYARLAESWLRAELLESLHRPREALPLYDALTFYGFIDAIFVPVAHLRKARLLESLGDRDGAIDHYTRFVELWKDCEPSEKPEVEGARSRLVALGAHGPTTAVQRTTR
jgi:tetratricopeptide (TPR) repeat protein